MPNRILRDWTDSDRVDALSADAERFFVRLIMKADDFGRYSAEVKRLRAFLFPLKDSLRETDCARWLAECEKAGLIRCYEAAGKRFLEIANFRQRLRNMREMHPRPPDAEDPLSPDGQMTGTRPVRNETKGIESDAETELETESDSEPSANAKANASAGATTGTREEEGVPTWEDVQAEALLRGVPETSARAFYQHHEGNSLWHNQYQRLIHWRLKLRTWAERDRESKGRHAHTHATGPDRNAGTYNAQRPAGGLQSKVR